MARIRIFSKDFFLLFLMSIVLIFNWYDGDNVRMLIFSIIILFSVSILKYADHYLGTLLLFVLSFSFILILNGYTSSLAYIAYISVPSIAFYIYGSYIGSRCESIRSIEMYLLITYILYVGVVISLSIIDYINTGALISTTRAIYTDVAQGAILVGDRSILSVGVIGIPLFFYKKGKERFLYLLIGLLSVFSSFHYLHRTPIAVLIICSFILLVHQFRRINFSTLIVLFLIVYLLFSSNNVIDSELIVGYVIRNDYDANSLGDRLPRWLDAIGKIFEYPFGWSQNNNTYHEYVHNLWLDTARISGIFPFIFFSIFTLMSFSFTIKRWRQKDSVSLTFLLLDFSFLLSSFVEPIFESYPTHAWMFIFYTGMKVQYFSRKRSIILYGES